jgi:hypothetical protein
MKEAEKQGDAISQLFNEISQAISTTVIFPYPRVTSAYTFNNPQDAEDFSRMWDGIVIKSPSA